MNNMGGYIEKAMKLFLDDEGVEYGGMDVQQDTIEFDWIDGEVSYRVIDEFENEFQYILTAYELDAGNMVNVKFYKN